MTKNIENLLKVEATRVEQLRNKREEKRLEEEYNEWQDGILFYRRLYFRLRTLWRDMGRNGDGSFRK